MIRMLQTGEEELCRQWYNWYIANTAVTFETEPLSEQEFSVRVQSIRRSYPWIILLNQAKPVGYAYLDAFNPRAAYQWTCDLSIYLDPLSRHQGYGGVLMQEIIRLARLDGYRTMMSLITEGNQASEKLHAKFGFVRGAQFANLGYKNGRWLGVSYYQKVLNSCPPTEPAPALPLNLDPYQPEETR